MNNSISSLFDSQYQLKAAVNELLQAGVQREKIGILRLDKSKVNPPMEKAVRARETSKTLTGGALGAAIGAIVGGIAVTTLTGGGTIFASGPLLTLFAGGAYGTWAGSIMGAYTELGTREIPLNLSEEAIRQGQILLTVEVEQSSQEIVSEIMERFGGHPTSLQTQH